MAFILSIVWVGAVFDYVSSRGDFAVSVGLLVLALGGSVGIVYHKPSREVAGLLGLLVERSEDLADIT